MAALGQTYAEVLGALYALEAHRGIDLKLERTRRVLSALGDPQHRFASAHIAGTNGKGSVAAMLHAILLRAGKNAGLYTSPHLVSFTERIRLADGQIDEGSVVRLAHEVLETAEDLAIELTFFEVTTVMAFLHFARRNVDLAVIETGLGGRFDATNVIDPLVSVITSIGFDHEEYLGRDLASIAFEKCGIIKRGRPVVCGELPAEALRVVEHAAQERHCALHIASALPPSWSVALRGAYQRDNAALAVAAADLIAERFYLSSDDIRGGVATAYWPGRLAVIPGEPTLILDGAHNLDGVTQLCEELPGLAEGRQVHLLFSVMRDKHWPAMVDMLAPLIASATVTSVSPTRAVEPGILAAAFAERGVQVTLEADVGRAFDSLCARVDGGSVVLVAGSLFLVGAVYAELMRAAGQRGLFKTAPTLHP